MNKITKEFLESEITNVEYTRLSGTLTHCAITVKSGFIFTGESSCVDPNEFDEEIGKEIAYEQAFETMWLPYGFALKQKIGGNFASRLQNEHAEVAERVSKLWLFIHADAFDQLNVEQRELLMKQHQAMLPYLEILTQRVALL